MSELKAIDQVKCRVKNISQDSCNCISVQRAMVKKENKIWFHFLFFDLEQSSKLSVPQFSLLWNKELKLHDPYSSPVD